MPRVACTQPHVVNPGNRNEFLLRALGGLVFRMVLADSGGDTATGSAPHGMPADAGARALALKNLTARVAQPAGAGSTVTQVASALARDIAVADAASERRMSILHWFTRIELEQSSHAMSARLSVCTVTEPTKRNLQ